MRLPPNNLMQNYPYPAILQYMTDKQASFDMTGGNPFPHNLPSMPSFDIAFGGGKQASIIGSQHLPQFGMRPCISLARGNASIDQGRSGKNSVGRQSSRTNLEQVAHNLKSSISDISDGKSQFPLPFDRISSFNMFGNGPAFSSKGSVQIPDRGLSDF